MGQKQGSAASLKSGRPKTNQSSKRPFINTKPSIDQEVQLRNVPAQQKSFSLNVGNHKNGYHPSPIKANRSSGKFLDFQNSGVPESPIFRNKGANLPDSLFGMSAYQQLGGNQNTSYKQQQQKGGFARQLYVCIGCNTPLFTNKDIVDHGSDLTTASSSGRAAMSFNRNCNFYHIKQREWMPTYGNDAGIQSHGALECYRKVCKRKLGQYSI